jgi:hypothetical protein
MATIRWTHMFLVVAALAGVAWTLSSTELWVAGQHAMPDWARERMNATIIMVSQAATALGSLVWGATAATAGVVVTFLAAAGLAIVAMIITRLHGWHLKEDLARPNSFQIEIIVPSWTQNLRKRERITKNEMEIIDKLHRLHLGPNPPEEWTSLRLDKEVLSRNR